MRKNTTANSAKEFGKRFIERTVKGEALMSVKNMEAVRRFLEAVEERSLPQCWRGSPALLMMP